MLCGKSKDWLKGSVFLSTSNKACTWVRKKHGPLTKPTHPRSSLNYLSHDLTSCSKVRKPHPHSRLFSMWAKMYTENRQQPELMALIVKVLGTVIKHFAYSLPTCMHSGYYSLWQVSAPYVLFLNYSQNDCSISEAVIGEKTLLFTVVKTFSSNWGLAEGSNRVIQWREKKKKRKKAE